MKGVKRNNAVGVKGKSGRKSYPVELARIQVIKNSWNALQRALADKDNLNIALPIALKDMTDKKEITGKDGEALIPVQEATKLIAEFLKNGSKRNQSS